MALLAWQRMTGYGRRAETLRSPAENAPDCNDDGRTGSRRASTRRGRFPAPPEMALPPSCDAEPYRQGTARGLRQSGSEGRRRGGPTIRARQSAVTPAEVLRRPYAVDRPTCRPIPRTRGSSGTLPAAQRQIPTASPSPPHPTELFWHQSRSASSRPPLWPQPGPASCSAQPGIKRPTRPGRTRRLLRREFAAPSRARASAGVRYRQRRCPPSSRSDRGVPRSSVAV